MYDSQRQGRISFYMVSAGEEAIAVGSAAAMEQGDRVFAQYREQGSLMFRGFGVEEFMDQLFATKKDTGKGRNMPVHYMSEELGLVSKKFCFTPEGRGGEGGGKGKMLIDLGSSTRYRQPLRRNFQTRLEQPML